MKSQAQYDVSFSHYFDMEPSFNAAAVGKSPKLNIAAAYAMQMAGFKRNPNTMYAGADAQFLLMKQFHGAGVQFMNDQIGLFCHKRLALQYAFKFKLFGGQLSTGISAGLLSESFDGTKVDLEESNDPAFSSSKVDGNSVDLAAGLYYSHRNWYVGVSAQHLNSPCVKLGETNELQVDATYYLTGGATIRLRNPFLTILPSFLVRSDLSGYRGDCYCEPKDNATNYYFDRLSKGKHVVETEYYVDRAGTYQTGTCTVQCDYSPEFGARTKAVALSVE